MISSTAAPDLFGGNVLETPQPRRRSSGSVAALAAAAKASAASSSPAAMPPPPPLPVPNHHRSGGGGTIPPNPQDDDHLLAAPVTPREETTQLDPMGISTSSSRTTRATNVPLNLRDGRRNLNADLFGNTNISSGGVYEDDPLLLGSSANHHQHSHASDTEEQPLQHDPTTTSAAGAAGAADHHHHDDEEEEDDDTNLNRPLLSSSSAVPSTSPSRPTAAAAAAPTPPTGLVRARKNVASNSKRRRRHHHHHHSNNSNHPRHQQSLDPARGSSSSKQRWLGRHFHACLLLLCRNNLPAVQSTVWCMNVLARLLMWSTMVALVAAVFWYSYELFYRGWEPHLIAWFSAGAFVLLGFPISMWGIVSHLANYNQPNVQVYVVRILWMVPIYSIESWLAMRFHKQAIYIETLRDFYESYVLYSFLQFLIQVLGGEESLILMLKDKSPTRGFHMWGLQWCVKPWLMGQPVRKTVYERSSSAVAINTSGGGNSDMVGGGGPTTSSSRRRTVGRGIKRVHWKSPFFVKCKFGVLQYVLLKLVTAMAVLLLEFKGWYKEGEFSWKSGYAYICALTNLSQCWALYCLIFFYYATRTELGPIRPVGKFLSVKSLVFFTWWQSVVIALLYQWGMIPEALVNVEHDWTKEDVAKGIQDYLICVEMFVAALVHTFVFPHTEYSPQAVQARNRALNQTPMKWTHKKKRLGRNKKYHSNYSTSYYSFGAGRDDFSKSSGMGLELTSLDSGSLHTAETWEDPTQQWQQVQPQLSPSSTGRALTSAALLGGPVDHGSDTSGGLSLEDQALLGDEEHGLTLSPVMDDEDDSRHHRSNYNSEDDGGGDEDDYDSGSAASGGAYYDDDDGDIMYDDEEEDSDARTATSSKPGFVSALLDSAIPRDLGDNTMGLVKGDYHVEKKTLLHHAATSDQYDLFSPNRRGPNLKLNNRG